MNNTSLPPHRVEKLVALHLHTETTRQETDYRAAMLVCAASQPSPG